MSDSWQPTIIAFACQWCTYAGADLAGTSRIPYPPSVRVIKVPCSARVDPSFVIRAFQRGADGVLVSGCHPGDCHYMEGNYLTRRRFSLAKPFMSYLGLEPGRVRVEWISAAEGQRFAEIVREMTEDIRALGPNRKMREQL